MGGTLCPPIINNRLAVVIKLCKPVLVSNKNYMNDFYVSF